jgi:lysozyme family protein
MADVITAVEAVLREEDSTLSGVVVNLGDGAGLTRFGITSKNYPALVGWGYFDVAHMPSARALSIATAEYTAAYAKPLHIADISDQKLATAVLSFGVNAGLKESAEALQKSICALGRQVEVDGEIGTVTLKNVNLLPGAEVLAKFAALAQEFYLTLAIKNPPLNAKFLNGWYYRVKGWSA